MLFRSVSFNPTSGKRKELAVNFASLPNGLVVGPDGALYTSNLTLSATPGDGSVLRIELPRDAASQPDTEGDR